MRNNYGLDFWPSKSCCLLIWAEHAPSISKVHLFQCFLGVSSLILQFRFRLTWNSLLRSESLGKRILIDDKMIKAVWLREEGMSSVEFFKCCLNHLVLILVLFNSLNFLPFLHLKHFFDFRSIFVLLSRQQVTYLNLAWLLYYWVLLDLVLFWFWMHYWLSLFFIKNFMHFKYFFFLWTIFKYILNQILIRNLRVVRKVFQSWLYYKIVFWWFDSIYWVIWDYFTCHKKLWLFRL